MRKCLLLLALFTFTQNVKAADWDFTIAEGEAVDVERAIAVQFNVNTNLWDYILKGNTLRVYIHHLQDDTRTNIPYHSYRINYHLNERNDVYGHYWIYTYSLTDNSFTGSAQGIYNRLIADMERTYNVKEPGPYSSPQAASNGTDIAIDIIDSNDIIIDEDENGEYLRFGEEDNLNGVGKIYFSDDNPTRLSKVAKSLTAASMKTALLGSASIPLNDVRITVTNTLGQVTSNFDTNILFSIKSVLDSINNKLGTTNGLLFDAVSGLGDIYEQEVLWQTEWGIYAQAVQSALSNLVEKSDIDYTDYLKLMVDTSGNPTNTAPLVWLNNTFTKLLGSLGTFGTYRGLLNNSQAEFLYGSEYRSAFNRLLRDMVNEYLQNNSSVSALGLLFDFQNLYLNMGSQFQEAIRQTNIVNAVSLGRDWLNLSTNDLASLPYWLNQQDFSSAPPIGVTNWQAQTRWTVLTNQYAKIGLTGSGAQANSAETWDYFKRLEMLLAALVYKPDNLDGEMPQDKTVSKSTEASDKQSEVNQSLDSLANALSTSDLENNGTSIVSLLTQFQSTLNQTFQPRYIVLFETGQEGQPTRNSPDDNDLDIEIAFDFQDDRFDGVLDIVRTIFGMVWATIGLFACWAVMKKCYFIGYKIAVFCFAFFRRILGL